MPEKPTPHLVNEYVTKFQADAEVSSSDKALVHLIDQFPNNTNREHVLLKVAVVNSLYGTNVWAIYNMAQHILDLKIDKRLEDGDPSLVTDIHCLTVKGKTRHHYSFATKYCSWHNQKAFPVYDQYVQKTLQEYKKQYAFYKFKQADLRDYPTFKSVIDAFCNWFNLNNFSYKGIDEFLWTYGRERFRARRINSKKGDNK
jgi:hypothetical protein